MFEIYDNVLSDNLFKSFVDTVTEDKKFHWFFSNDSTIDNLPEDKNIVPTKQLIRSLLFYPENWVDESMREYTFKIITEIVTHLKYKQASVSRIKLNCLMNDSNITQDKYNIPHVDTTNTSTDTKTAILYLNDSDGDTFLFNERYDGAEPDSFTVHTRVTPKANKLLVFDNNVYHASQNPIKNKQRFVMNINLNSIEVK